MHADAAPKDDGFGLSPEETETIADLEAAGLHHVAHSLISVLLPAHPPKPKNARIIRLFDYEAAKNDPQPAESTGVQAPEAPEAPKAKPEPKSREAAKAARNQSLLAAARLI